MLVKGGPGDFRSQSISRHFIDPQSRNILSPASEELTYDVNFFLIYVTSWQEKLYMQLLKFCRRSRSREREKKSEKKKSRSRSPKNAEGAILVKDEPLALVGICACYRHFDGLLWDCSISIASTLEILQSCTEPLICY